MAGKKTKSEQVEAVGLDTVEATQEQLEASLTIDQLIEELVAAKAAGLVVGSERVMFGDAFMRQCSPVRAVALLKSPQGGVVASLSAQSELEWTALLSAVEGCAHVVTQAGDTPEDTVKRLNEAGMVDIAAQLERRELGKLGLGEPQKKPTL